MPILECAACCGPGTHEENGYNWHPSCLAWLPSVSPVNYRIYLSPADPLGKHLNGTYTLHATTTDLDLVLKIVRGKIHEGNACQILPDPSKKPRPTAVYLPPCELPPLPPACSNCGSERYELANPGRTKNGDLFLNDMILCSDCGATLFDFSPRRPIPPADDPNL